MEASKISCGSSTEYTCDPRARQCLSMVASGVRLPSAQRTEDHFIRVDDYKSKLQQIGRLACFDYFQNCHHFFLPLPPAICPSNGWADEERSKQRSQSRSGEALRSVNMPPTLIPTMAGWQRYPSPLAMSELQLSHAPSERPELAHHLRAS